MFTSFDTVFINPAFHVLFLSLFLPFFSKGSAKMALFIAPIWACVYTFLNLSGLLEVSWFGFSLRLLQVDKFNNIIAIMISSLFFITQALTFEDDVKALSIGKCLLFGGLLGQLYSGDILSWFMFMQISTIALVMIIWVREQSNQNQQRGVIISVWLLLAAMLVISGILGNYFITKSIVFTYIDVKTFGGALLFIGVLIYTGVLPFSNWQFIGEGLKNSYSTYAVNILYNFVAFIVMSKLFSGEPILVYLGLVGLLYCSFKILLARHLYKIINYSFNGISSLFLIAIGLDVGSFLFFLLFLLKITQLMYLISGIGVFVLYDTESHSENNSPTNVGYHSNFFMDIVGAFFITLIYFLFYPYIMDKMLVTSFFWGVIVMKITVLYIYINVTVRYVWVSYMYSSGNRYSMNKIYIILVLMMMLPLILVFPNFSEVISELRTSYTGYGILRDITLVAVFPLVIFLGRKISFNVVEDKETWIIKQIKQSTWLFYKMLSNVSECLVNTKDRVMKYFENNRNSYILRALTQSDGVLFMVVFFGLLLILVLVSMPNSDYIYRLHR